MGNSAVRRHHRQRLLRKRRWYKWAGRFLAGRVEPALSGHDLGIVFVTPQRCSGPCCGNPRRHWGELTVQERKAEQAAEDAIAEWRNDGL